MENKDKKKKIIIIILIIVIFILLCFLSIRLISNLFLNKINEEDINEEDISETIVEDDTKEAHEVLNIMLIGADNSGRNYNSYNEQNSDMFKIVSLDYTDSKIKITSLNKDVVVWMPDTNEFGHMNWPYAKGGPAYALNTINYNLDLDVSKYVTFSFAGFIDVIDELGGIDIELSEKEAQAMNNPAYGNKVSINAKKGSNHMQGNDALTYARINYLDSDFVRMDRQNKVIKAVIDKLKTSSFDDLISVINTCLPYITTNLTSSEIRQFIQDVLKFDLGNIQTKTYPINDTKDVAIAKNSISGYVLRSYSNQVIELHKFIYGTNEYEPTQKIYDNETKTYNEISEFYENGNLLP